MWFDSWADLARVVIVGAASYATLVVAVRISGKRSLAQLNAFDLVVTVALGSVLATILLSGDVSWTEGAAAFGVLILLQFLVALASSRIRPARRLIAAAPTLLVVDGEMREDAIARNRLARSEVLQVVRSSGVGGIDQVGAVVLEANGRLSVIPRDRIGDGTALPFDEFSRV